MSVAIEPLRNGFAGEVSGIDCTKPLSPADVSAVNAGMVAYGVLVFHDQNLTDEAQLTRADTPGLAGAIAAGGLITKFVKLETIAKPFGKLP